MGAFRTSQAGVGTAKVQSFKTEKMPGFDRTGPASGGPMTGWRMGKCTNFGQPRQRVNEGEAPTATEEDVFFNRGRGMGFGPGRGRGWGRGGGRQFRQRGGMW